MNDDFLDISDIQCSPDKAKKQTTTNVKWQNGRTGIYYNYS